MRILLAILLLGSVWSLCVGSVFEEIVKGNLLLEFLVDTAQNEAHAKLKDVTQLKLSAQLGLNLNFTDLRRLDTDDTCYASEAGKYTVCIFYEGISQGYKISWRSNDTSVVFQDCISFGDSHWYGGHETYTQLWPVEKLKLVDYAYITNGLDNSAVKETYWLNSLGGYVIVDRTTPLYIDINHAVPNSLCFIGKLGDTYVKRTEVVLNYTLVASTNPRAAHLHAVENYLGKPTAHPDDRMIRDPIWTTWAKYKAAINDSVVIDFATDVNQRGYFGQIEIDDAWETCYGEREFDVEGRFKNIKSTVQKLKDMGFRVTLWTHPFVNNECPDARRGEEKDYFVKNLTGSTNTSWWDGASAHMIDFTRTDPSEWFVNKLKKIQELIGIDSFKFDAGEATYAPKNPVLNASVAEWPNKLTEDYVRTCARLGNLTEVRSAWHTQNLGIFVRMLDKDSKWGYDNGLKSLITTLLQMNMIGYSMVLPDMIGGNGYQGAPSAELLVRWAQANVFMPSMQLSYLPWDITSTKFDVPAIAKASIKLHKEQTDEIIKAMEKHIKDGSPVNPPVWWIDPTDPDLHGIDDQYLLGERIMVAPVVDEGAVSRNITFPKGKWRDGNFGHIIEGGKTVVDYPAPIDVLPWFEKAD